jgi:polysaccharide pyruvyl transferase WcaK-like protein
MVAADVQSPAALEGAVRVAFNLSPASVRQLGHDIHEAARLHADGLRRIMEDAGCKVVLVPHVVCPSYPADDDGSYLNHVRAALPKTLRGEVELIEGDIGFVETKKVLANCHAVVAARMHCAINAMAAGVPTILLSYSQKAIGMAEYVYGSRQWALPVDDFASRGLTLALRRMLQERTQIADYLRQRTVQIQEDMRAAVHALEELLPSKSPLRPRKPQKQISHGSPASVPRLAGPSRAPGRFMHLKEDHSRCRRC